MLLFMLAATFTACRQESDEQTYVNGLNYSAKTAETYTQMWDVLWTGYNQNYVGWAIETVDWDEQNQRIRPLFEALDQEVKNINNSKIPNTDSLEIIKKEALKVFHEALDTLHDGHTYVQYVDYATGIRQGFRPSNARRMQQRVDYGDTAHFEKTYYIETTGDIAEGKCEDVTTTKILYLALYTKYLPKLKEYSNVIKAKMDQAQREGDEETYGKMAYIHTNLENMYAEIMELYTDQITDANLFYEYYLSIISQKKYKVLANATGIIPNICENSTEAQFFYTKDGIAGYRLSAFNIPRVESLGNAASDIDKDIINAFQTCIADWHDSVYAMHKEGKLKGVILDVRNNGGGNSDDLGLFAGLLYKGDSYTFGTKLMKNGVGRLDYAPSTDLKIKLYADNTEDITEPIVILTNWNSASCAEISTATVKQHSNGISMGTTTFGAGSALMSDANYNSALGYAGCVGTRDVTPVYAYIPFMLASLNNLGIIESTGITPDIFIKYDKDLYKSTGRDNQFERALQYIREGK